MIGFRSTDRITVAGLPGTGKTVLTKYLCSLVDPAQLLIYDPLQQYTQFPKECVYLPKSDDVLEFDSVCKQLCARSNCLFVIEEAERYLGQGKSLGPYAFTVINRGRNWGIGILAVTRRIQRLSKDFFDLCNCLIAFKCGLKSREYLTDMVGKPISNRIISLPPYHFIHYSLRTEEATSASLDIEGTRPHLKETRIKNPKGD